jgi:D-tyrosyl-tRNA(Tyr) deacylase
MRAVAQRVCEARVEVEGQIVGQIGRGLLVYLAAGKHDSPSDPVWMADKLGNLRVFEDESGKLARSVLDVAGEVLVVSQFTLYGDVRRGRRPSFDLAATPEPAELAYRAVCSGLQAHGLRVSTGQFRAMMQVYAQVDGPITILIDSEKVF